MQVYNQTLSEIVKQVIQTSVKPDYTGWILGIIGILVGCIAIVITVLIFRKQSKTNKKLDDLKKAGLYFALVRIYNSINDCKTSISSPIQIVSLIPNIEEKIATAKILIENGSEGYNKFIGEITKDFDFLQMNMFMFELHDDIEKLKHNIKGFSDKTIFDVNFGSLEENIDVWLSKGRSAIQKMDFILEQIDNELKPVMNYPTSVIEFPKNEPTVDSDKKSGDVL